MWISKVEDLSEQKDSIQLNSHMSNQNFMRSMSTGGRRSIGMVAMSDLTRESAAFVTFSRSSIRQSGAIQSAAPTASLSGVDMNLFSAD